jgi:Ion channel
MDTHVTALVLAMGLVLTAVVMHYEALRRMSLLPFPKLSGRLRTLLVIGGATVAHVGEAALFAAGYWLGEGPLHLGRFAGADRLGPLQLFYFSLETFTTQGVGDIYAVGPMRLIASLEPLAGLILIGWTTSFTFLVMQRYWRLQTTRATSRPRVSARRPDAPTPDSPRPLTDL